MLEWMLKYRAMGLSVIPLRPRSKEPLIPWQEFQKRIATVEEIASWIGVTPGLNVGIVTGAVSGIVVVDLDGSTGLASGRSLRLTSPVSVLTGNGMQLYYQATDLRNSVRKIPGLDIRGEGGYVAAPPSLHPNGKNYRWSGTPIARHMLPVFRESLKTQLAEADNRGGTASEKGWIAEALAGLESGGRNIAFLRILGRLRGDGFSRDDARALLIGAAEKCNGVDILDRQLENVWSRYSPNEKASAAITRVGKAEGLGKFLEDKQEVKWLCHPFIARQSIGFVAGLPETSKTWLLIDLALELTRDRGCWTGLHATDRAKVLFIDQERFKGETQRRFSALAAGKGLSTTEIHGLFIKSGTDIKLNDDRSFELFRAELHELQPDIVMVDSFATFHNVPENNRMEIQVVMDRIKTLRNEIGCTFVFINHETKQVFQDIETTERPSMFRMAGSVGISAAAEFCLTVRKMADGSSIVHHTKSTLAQAGASFYVNVVDTERGIAVKGVA